MGKSKRALAFQRFKFTDPGWTAVVLPVAGSTDSSVFTMRIDPYTGETKYGQELARYSSKKLAEKLAEELNQNKNELLSKAFP